MMHECDTVEERLMQGELWDPGGLTCALQG